MKITLRELRRIIRLSLTEAALSPSSDMAISISDRIGNGKIFVLYDPKKINVDDVAVDGKVERASLRASIIAVIDISGEGEVHSPAAIKGYGPFIYDVAMSWFPEGIYSDREMVSQSAQKVWKYYFENRRDVEKDFLPEKLRFDDDINNPLNYRYRLPVGPEISNLRTNHERIAKARAMAGDDKFDYNLWNEAYFFFKKMSK